MLPDSGKWMVVGRLGDILRLLGGGLITHLGCSDPGEFYFCSSGTEFEKWFMGEIILW